MISLENANLGPETTSEEMLRFSIIFQLFRVFSVKSKLAIA